MLDQCLIELLTQVDESTRVAISLLLFSTVFFKYLETELLNQSYYFYVHMARIKTEVPKHSYRNIQYIHKYIYIHTYMYTVNTDKYIYYEYR